MLGNLAIKPRVVRVPEPADPNVAASAERLYECAIRERDERLIPICFRPTYIHEEDRSTFLAFVGCDPAGYIILYRCSNGAPATWNRPLERRPSEDGYNTVSYDQLGPMEAQLNSWTVNFIYVAPPLRRHGIAKALVFHAAGAVETDVSDLGWYTPLTFEAEALIRKFAPNGFLICK
jgi:GNAT superfamily N-acetyltransferase